MRQVAVTNLQAGSLVAVFLEGDIGAVDALDAGGALDLDDVPFGIARRVQDVGPGVEVARHDPRLEDRLPPRERPPRLRDVAHEIRGGNVKAIGVAPLREFTDVVSLVEDMLRHRVDGR